MKKLNFFPVLYMFGVTAAFSLVIIGFSRVTAGRVQANAQIAFERAVLSVFPDIQLESPGKAHEKFVEVMQPVSGSDDKEYVYTKDGVTAGYAVVVQGQGFWAPITAVVGIKADRKTVIGFAVVEQSETPGLGARIAEPDFCEKFQGRVLAGQDKPMGIVPVGSELKGNQVHAITGATQTCVRLEKLINDGLAEWMKRNHVE